MIVSPLPGYLSQRDNVNPHTKEPRPNDQCSITAGTMVLNWIGDKYSIPNLTKERLNEETVYLGLESTGKQNEITINGRVIKKYNTNISENVRYYIDTVLAGADIPLRANIKLVNSYSDIRDTLEKYRHPLFSSTGTALTSAGHFIVVIGYSFGGIIVNDPYGTWERNNSNFNNPSEHYKCGYYTTKCGDGIYYDKSIVDKIYCSQFPANVIILDKL